MPIGVKVVEKSLVAAVPAAPLRHHAHERLERVLARREDHEPRVERVGPAAIGSGRERLWATQEVGEGAQDEGVGIEEDELAVLRQAEDVQLRERGGKVSSTWTRDQRAKASE